MQRNELQLWWKGLTPLWHLLMCWGLTDTLTRWGLCLQSFKMPAKNWAWNLGGRGAEQGRQGATLRSEAVKLCVWMCTHGQLREREAVERKQEGVSGMRRERARQRMWEGEGRMEKAWIALQVQKEFHGIAIHFAFSELILDYHLPYGRLPEGLG